MSAFPTANSTVYYNDAGEPLGWSDESYSDPYDDPYDDDYRARADDAAEARYEEIVEMDDDELLLFHEVAVKWELDVVHEQFADRKIDASGLGCEWCDRPRVEDA